MEVLMSEFKRGDTASWDTAQVRREQRTQQPRKKKRRKKRANWFLRILLYVVFVAVASFLLARVGWALMTDLCAFDKELITATVEVTAEDDMDSISEKLYDSGLIEYKWFFQLFGKVAKAEEKVGLGTYELSTEMDYRALIAGMKSSSGGNLNAETVRVTIPEGYTVAQTIRLLAEKGVNTEEALLEAAKTYNFNHTFIDNDSEDINRLEGYLFPDTYDFYVGEKASSALNRLIKNFNSKIDDELLEAAEAKGYDLKEIVIIASLIEKETDGTDHSKIASVIYNRLADEGSHGTYRMLNIDAALLYALPEGTTSLTNDDKLMDSPYNLYKYAGLPPTAIANPGAASLNAALNPETTEYYYYALGKDGRHHYSKTLDEHNNFLNSGSYIGN